MSSLEMTLCSKGSKLARWSSSELSRSLCRLLGLLFGGSFTGAFTLNTQSAFVLDMRENSSSNLKAFRLKDSSVRFISSVRPDARVREKKRAA